MPSSRHHAEWLSLIEVSGPFLTPPVLERVFPQGLDKDDSPEAKEHARNLRLAYDEWDDNQSGHRPNPAIHKAWIDFVLKQTLGLPDELLAEGQAIPQTLKATIAEHGEVLRPDAVVRNPEGDKHAGKVRLLVQAYPVEQDLEKPVVGRHWKASPATRMMELLHATDVRLGLVTNGEQWMLVDAPRGDTTGFASWYANLWFDEPLTLRAFRSLLGVSRFFSVADDETLEAMLAESATHQQEVTDQLGLQVRRAVEVLIQSLDRADQDHGRELLAQVPEAVLYEAALTVMMRLVFLFSAEERGLLLLGDPLYDQHYAVSTLVAQLQETADRHGEEVLERRLDAWVRLLSTFRAVFGGVQHERMKLPAYAGKLFNPDRFPFLEGRRSETTWRDTPASPLPVNNRTVLHLLRALQYLQGKHQEDPAVRLSFQSLDIEQIGHVYESLLDHTAKRAPEPKLGLLGAKGKETEVALAEQERLAEKGEADLLAFLGEQTGRQEKTLKRGLDTPLEGEDAKRLRAACGNEEKLFRRVLPFSGLLRYDTFDRPVVIRKGSVFVTAGTDRRSSGTHYTPRSLTEPIVRYTLEPLVYIGPAEGKPKEEWELRSVKELLDLKICDMACGSGAFLVQACRYLSERLLEAWERAEAEVQPGEQGQLFSGNKSSPPPVVRITPYGMPSTGGLYEQIVPVDVAERLAYARRIVAQRCLYGVDKNHLAAEMAKLSLWLLTLAKDKPFTFLDHAIRSGDSLVGIRDLDQLKNFHLEADQPGTLKFKGPLEDWVEDAIALRKKIEAAPANTVEEVQSKERLLAEVEEKTARLRYAADLLLSVEFQDAPEGKERLHSSMAIQAGYYIEKGTPEEFAVTAKKALHGQLTFHWPLEFPEVFERGGFDAIVGNPPFMHGSKIAVQFGMSYADYLRLVNPSAKGKVNLVVFFLLKASQLIFNSGAFGLVLPDTAAEGHDRQAGLQTLLDRTFRIQNAVTGIAWPGSASVIVSRVIIVRGNWEGAFLLNDVLVSTITSRLAADVDLGTPFQLAAMAEMVFLGVKPDSLGFVLDVDEAERLLSLNREYRAVLKPYISGIDLNRKPILIPDRYVIDFTGLEEVEAQKYPHLYERLYERVKPDCKWKRWWQFNRSAARFYQIASKYKQVIAASRVTKFLAFQFVPADWVYADKVVLVPSDMWEIFLILSSAIHQCWAEANGTNLGGTFNYQPTECTQTMPLCSISEQDDRKGQQYYECRRIIMEKAEIGLTDLYNRFHDPEEEDADIRKLHDLHVEMDHTVAAAYGWQDLNLAHDFHETKQGIRFTISEAARREVLARLLKLNHERYAEEVKQGLHDKKGKAKKPSSNRGKKKTASADGASLFDERDEEESPPAKMRKERERQLEEPANRSTPIEQLDTDDIMAAFRQAARGRGWLDRDELLKEVSVALGYQRLGPKIEEALRGHLRAAIRRRIVEADGASLVRAGTGTMADYGLDELRETFRSVMRKGASYEREDVIHALARYLGFARITDNSRDTIKSAINSAIRHGVLGYEGSVIWREE